MAASWDGVALLVNRISPLFVLCLFEFWLFPISVLTVDFGTDCTSSWSLLITTSPFMSKTVFYIFQIISSTGCTIILYEDRE